MTVASTTATLAVPTKHQPEILARQTRDPSGSRAVPTDECRRAARARRGHQKARTHIAHRDHHEQEGGRPLPTEATAEQSERQKAAIAAAGNAVDPAASAEQRKAKAAAEGMDDDTAEQFWQRSLANFAQWAGDATALRAFWTREFGEEWRNFRVPSHLVTPAEQVAAEWREVADELRRRSGEGNAADAGPAPATTEPTS